MKSWSSPIDPWNIWPPVKPNVPENNFSKLTIKVHFTFKILWGEHINANNWRFETGSILFNLIENLIRIGITFFISPALSDPKLMGLSFQLLVGQRVPHFSHSLIVFMIFLNLENWQTFICFWNVSHWFTVHVNCCKMMGLRSLVLIWQILELG